VSGAGTIDALRDLAVAYCEAIHFARPQVFEAMCHEKFLMTAVTGSGGAMFWEKQAYLARVASREPFPGAPSFEILGLDASGDIGRVHLRVDVPPRRFEDHLGFVRVDGAWRLITKVFRTASGPDL
jgi:hypothetical protein